MSKPSAAPWVARGDCVYSDDETGSIVARCGGRGFEFTPRSDEETEANVRLIVASPKLLRLAEMLLEADLASADHRDLGVVVQPAIDLASEIIDELKKPRRMSKTVKDLADGFQKHYGFMAVNAARKDAAMFRGVHADWMAVELKDVHDELLRRGLKVIETEEEYNAGVAEHGVPPAFQKEK